MNNPNIAALVKSEKSARKRTRYLALLHFTEGHSVPPTQACLKPVEPVSIGDSPPIEPKR